MRAAVLPLLFIASLISSGCAENLQSQPPPAKWTTGFWFWGNNWSHLTPVTHMPDALFVQVAEFRDLPGRLYADIPNTLPAAREYWLVYRYAQQGVPDEVLAYQAAWSFAGVLKEARVRNLNIAGIQLDIDSPTRALPQYAAFLRTLRRNLPAGTQVSITCLLDWFRDGTSIADVIRETDEFVPQFYDAAPPDSRTPVIAVRFDPARWNPVFNRFSKRFRVGISTFGRAEVVHSQSALAPGSRAAFYADLTPLDITSNSALTAETTQNDAGETVLTFRATRPVTVNWDRMAAGEAFRFILPTREGVQRAITDTHRMGRYCAGIVFFRWPEPDEVLVMAPDEILAGYPATPALDPMDGECAAVSCVDLYLVNGGSVNPAILRYRITTSGDLDYFIPDRKTPVRMNGNRHLDVSIPAWAGRGRLLVGRAVSPAKVTFSLEKIQ